LSLTVLTAFPVGILIHAVFAHDRQKELVKFWIAGSILNVILNIYLIPKYGISGAAWASLASQIIINSLIWLKLKKITPFSIIRKVGTLVLATFMMSVAIILLKQIGMPLFVIIPLAIATYFGSLMFSGENPLKELQRES